MKKVKFNIIDFLIIVAIILVVALGVYIIGNKSETVVNKEKTKVLITIEERNLGETAKAYYEENAKTGSTVFVGIREKVAGTLKKVDIANAIGEYEHPVTGEKKILEKKGEYDLKFVFEAEITENENDFLIGTDKIKIGKELNFAGKGFSGYGYVVAIEKVGGDK